MADFFSSAWSYLSGSATSEGNKMVGVTVDVGEDSRLKIRKVIAEGGYGFVFVAQDVKTGVYYALKRQVVSKENVKLIKQEIAFLKQLSGHPNIIKFVAAAGIPPAQTSHGNAEFMIQTELCTGGKMEDVVVSLDLSPRQVLRVFYETCSAVAHMHAQHPPIVHRDLKVENLLLSSDGRIKLCDFGSATTKCLAPDHSWTQVQRGLAEEEIQRNTTPMYRAPEMIDLYSNYPINEKSDIWALGCLLYKLCFKVHPFEDSSKLRIMSAKYKIPVEDSVYTAFHPIIRSCLVLDPMDRPSVDSLLAQLYPIADSMGEDFERKTSEPLVIADPSSSRAPQVQQRSSEDTPATSDGPGVAQQAHKFFGFMKDGAGKLMSNIKTSSNKVFHGMSSVIHHHKHHLDVTYITSRIIVMSFPYEDTTHNNNIDEVAGFLETSHPAQYLVFNLSGYPYDTTKLNNQVADFDWPHRRMPDLEKLVDLCRNLHSWLRADPQNVIVIHCHDGYSVSSLAVAAYLLFLGLYPSPKAALQLFTLRRMPDIHSLSPSPSQIRYLNYIHDLVGPRSYRPHSRVLVLKTLQLTSIPLFNEIKTGCKPFVEVFQNGQRVFTSVSQGRMDAIRGFTLGQDTRVAVALGGTSDGGGGGVRVQGNVFVVVHHIKSIPAGSEGMTAVQMLRFQFHTGFLTPSSTSFVLEKRELDGPPLRHPEKFPGPFQLVLECQFDKAGQSSSSEKKDGDISWQNFPDTQTSPLACFSTGTEQDEVLKQFETAEVVTLHHTNKLPHGHFYDQQPPEEATSVGGGQGLALAHEGPGAPSHSDWKPPSASHDFPAATTAGYTAFGWEDSDSSDEEGEGEGEGEGKEGRGLNHIGEGRTTTHVHQGERHHDAASSRLLDISGLEGDTHDTQTVRAIGEQLVQLGSGEIRAPHSPPPSSSSSSAPTPPAALKGEQQQSEKASKPTTTGDIFGLADPWGTTAGETFDPWETGKASTHQGTATSTAEATAPFNNANLLFSVSEETEPYDDADPSSSKAKAAATQKKAKPPSAATFDPFAPLGHSSNLLLHPEPIHPSSSVPNLHVQAAQETFDPSNNSFFPTGSGGGGKLGGSTRVSPDMSKRSGSIPHINPFGNGMAMGGARVPKAAGGGSSNGDRGGGGVGLGHSTSKGLGSVFSHSQPNLIGMGNSMGSPRRASPTPPPSGTQAPYGYSHGPQNPSFSSSSSSRPPPPHVVRDPFAFAGLGNFGVPTTAPPASTPLSHIMATSSSAATTHHQTTRPAMSSRPGYYINAAGQQQHQPRPSAPPTTSVGGSNGRGRTQQQQQQHNSRPLHAGQPTSSQDPKRHGHTTATTTAGNYSSWRSSSPVRTNVFGTTQGVRPNISQDRFQDILAQGGFSTATSRDQGPVSLNAMKKKNEIEVSLDPDSARVRQWAEGKERNIRALLSSLHTIIWDGEKRWTPVGMHQLLEPDQVKKFYRKACLSVHPDKAQDTDHEKLARAIFDELNEAFAKFEESGARPLF